MQYLSWKGLAHGVGRSGDLTAQQPKAAGSSLIANLCKYLAVDAIRMAGFKNCKDCLVIPVCTGLSLTLIFNALQQLDKKAGRDRKVLIISCSW